MSLLVLFESAIKALKQECFALAKEAGLFLQVDECGNIWLGEGNDECFRVYGWNKTYRKINEMIIRKALKDSGTIN